MKIVVLIVTIVLLMIALLSGSGLFSVIPQELELKQWLFIFVTLASFVGLIVLHLTKQPEKGLYLFFLVYPILAQATFYLNISSPYFMLTPALIYLVIHYLFLKDPGISRPMGVLLLFCLSTLISLIVAGNKFTATLYIVLGVGGFALSAYVVYAQVATSKDPIKFIHGLALALILGSTLYFLIEIVFFEISPSEIPKIIMRRWSALPQGRYFTGGFREPVGLAFVFSIFFWIILYFVQNPIRGRNQKWIDWIALGTMVLIIIISGTRTAIINLINIFLVLWILGKILNLQVGFRLKFQHLLAILVVAGLNIYLLLPRTIQATQSLDATTSREPINVSIGGQSYQLVGTTGSYYKFTILSFEELIQNPLGTGPLNAPIPENSTKGGLGYFYSFITNLIVIGATFGWLSLALWTFFVVYVTMLMFRLNRTNFRKFGIFVIGIILLGIFIASLLPGSSFIGPAINWSNFNYYEPLSPQTLAVPAAYPAIISGVILGALVGIIRYAGSQRRTTITPPPY